jgi:hypothetical protein
MIKQLYEHKNIIITIIPQSEHETCKLHYSAPLRYIDKYIHYTEIKNKQYDLIKTGNSFSEDGSICPEWNKMAKVGEFWKRFYHQAKLPYSIRYQYTDINRNKEREHELYNKIVSNYGNNYIFVMDHGHITYDHKGRQKYVDKKQIMKQYPNIPIFHPNINVYKDDKNHKFYSMWNDTLISDNLLDYCTILEKATHINMIDSSFGCLCAYLDMSFVKTKKIKTTLDLVDYHKSFKKWTLYK